MRQLNSPLRLHSCLDKIACSSAVTSQLKVAGFKQLSKRAVFEN